MSSSEIMKTDCYIYECDQELFASLDGFQPGVLVARRNIDGEFCWARYTGFINSLDCHGGRR